ncbi:TIGR02679 family protein [Streptomyces sp. ISL-43]|uniref:TIGR02679 family protein n=1 Tax=Streptomyces sp. ISL-43 TaxID=2819183 RepID=UPI001BE51CC2|nr:TIGR02679 family protein [Streptomyces sp. ISL-43]MBT2446711.1 TIGR02679 family protein [Streptomyces sp. ISL-43]
MSTDQPSPPPYTELHDEGWPRLLAAARRRLERTGGTLHGDIGLTAPTEAERRTVIGVTGRYRPETVKRLTVPLADLDAYLHGRYGTGLLKTLGRLHGPLRDRPAERADEVSARAQALEAAHASPLAALDWYPAWLEQIAADGTLTRLLRRGDAALLQAAVRVLEKLPGVRGDGGRSPLPLPVLAEWATGDTKALLPGGRLEQLVLRALAQRAAAGDGQPVRAVPRDRAGRRALWESAGAVADDLASQVLVLNIGARGEDVVCDWLRDATGFGIPFRLTLHQLTAADVVPAAREIHVCENPAVLRAAAAELADRAAALVCTEGIPSAACHKLLADAARSGARLHWRADFDWTGLRITAAAVERHGARPWRMSTADYRSALAGGETTPLTGPPAASPWDPALASALRASGQAVMEERLLTELLSDLG